MNQPDDEEARKKADRDKADREKIAALGYAAENPAVLAHFQELEDKKAAERITQQDVFRGMDKQAHEIADKQTRDEARQQYEQQLQKSEEVGKNERDKADREKLAALGYDAENPAVLKHFQELLAKEAVGRISRQDVLRGMEHKDFEIAHKEGRDEARRQYEQQLQKDRDSNHAGGREEARQHYEQVVEKNRDAPDRGAAREAFEKSLTHENRDKALQQNQTVQRKQDIDRGY